MKMMGSDQAGDLRQLVHGTSNNIKNKTKRAKIITVTSGKGGVGKSNFVANLAIALKRQGKEVIIIDADLGFSNIEVIYNSIPNKSLKHVIFQGASIEEVINEGPVGVQFISGGSGFSEITKISRREQERLTNSLEVIDEKFDYILIDTGAGVNNMILNFIDASDDTIVIATAEPTSITDAYALIKIAKEQSSQNNEFSLIVNRTDNDEEGQSVVNKISFACDKFLNLHIKSLGFLPDDNHLVKSVKQQKPISILYPNSSYTKSLEYIANNITNNNTSVKNNDSFIGRLFKNFTIR